MRKKKSKQIEISDTSSDEVIKLYNDFLENFKIEFGHFLRLAEQGKTNFAKSLECRQYSIFLRELLSNNFRRLSISLDKYRKEKRKSLTNEFKKM